MDAQLILGSDPDADRVAIQVKDRKGDYVQISGNQTGVLLLDYLIGAKRRAGTLPENPVALKSLVTTQLAQVVAEANGVRCYNTFTGFKFLAQKKDQLESSGEGKVIMSYEESYGYMLGDYVRDKDAVSASVELTEMAAWYASQGMTLYDALQALFEKYGYYGEKTLNLVMPGLDGLKKMADLMANLREKPPVEIAGVAVKEQKDYKDGSVVNVADGCKSTMELSGSNVLRYEMADGTSLIVRPSGTEPKGQGLYPGQRRRQGGVRRKGGQVRRLGREPQRLKRQAGHRARSKRSGPGQLGGKSRPARSSCTRRRRE